MFLKLTSILHNNFYFQDVIQDAINQADNLFNKAVENNLILNLNNLLRALDTYNWAIQLNKIEKENNQNEIIDEFKYDYCVYKINKILYFYLGEQNEEIRNLLEQLQQSLELRIKEELDNTMRDIDTDIKNTAKEFIKLILRTYPYPGYNNEYNVNEIFDNKSNSEIKTFIIDLKAEYNNANLGTNNIIDTNEGENRSIATYILGHLNNIYDHYR